jgi:uncharacterized protein YndB with AHSA1/START domain
MNSTPITVSAVVNAPLAATWAAWTEAQHITNWNFASDDWACPTATNDLRVGGSFNYLMAAKDGSMQFEFSGEYTDVQLHHCTEYRLGDGRMVQVNFEPLSEHSTRVVETFDLEQVNTAELQRSGWQAILDNFKKHAELVST